MIDVVIMSPLLARRDWLHRVLRADGSLRIVSTATTFAFLRSLLNETVADVGIIDLTATPEPVLVRDWFHELLDVLSIVVLASVPDAWIFNKLVRAEGGALLRTDAPGTQILAAIHAASVGLLTLDSSLVPQPEGPDDFFEELTPREVDVLRLLAEGLANREIADRLNISEHTIKFHIRSILGKLRASTRTEAVTRGFRSGLIEL